ncbi:hypothetical protein QZH41_015806, partial [Actinostola sp. cb2023]
DSKSQELTASVWVTQVWRNPFLTWKESRVGGLSSIVVDPSEIWTPDVGLMNNADETISVAGGKEIFKTAVIIQSDGLCTWRSPATFRSDCEIDVRYWPFDTQKCLLMFSSYTMGKNQLALEMYKQTKNKADNFATNGDWTVKGIRVNRQEVQNSCCKTKFDAVHFEVILKRKPLYFILNLITPSAVLCFLTLLSFAIPTESGERIGFITTLLLAMTVYLLLIAEVLPETSNQLPITGLLFVLTIVESAVILLATVIVLRCFHGTGEPYGWLQRMYCCCCPCRGKIPSQSFAKSHTNSLKNGKTSYNHDVDDIDSPSDIPSAFDQFESKEFDSPTWEDISIFLNRVFFVLSVIMVAVSFLVVYLNAAYLSQV